MTKHLRFAGTIALAAAFSMPLAGVAGADHDHRDDCHHRLEKAKDKIDRDAARHGRDSRKVDHDRDKLERERQWCRDHNADWDHNNAFDVGIYIGHPH